MIIRKIPWTRQPPFGVPLDRNHPAFQGLILAYCFNEGGNTAIDLAAIEAAGRPNPNIGLTESPTPMVGRYWATNEGGLAWDWDASLGEGDPTFLLDYMPNARIQFFAGDGYSRLLVAEINPVGTNPGLWRTGPTGEGGSWDIIESTTDYTMFQVSNTGIWDATDTIPMSRDYGAHLLTFEDGGTTSIYENGSLLATKASPVTSFGGSDRVHTLNGQFSEDRGFNGTWNLLVLWRKGLNDSLAQSLSANPWQIFQPRTIYIPVDVTAAGAGASGRNPGMSGGMLHLEGGMQG